MSVRIARLRLPAAAVPFGLAVLALAAPVPTGPEKISVGYADAQPDGGSSQGAVTGNGRFVAFDSSASNLLTLATAGTQVYVRDRKSGTNLLVSHTAAGPGGKGDSHYPAISGSGQFVVFGSDATDLAPVDGNAVTDVFLADMKAGTVTRISEAAGGGDSDGQSYCFGAAISKNGRYAVYTSKATNLVGDDTNGSFDVFLYDGLLGTTALVSRNTAGAPSNGASVNPSISSNGRYVTYFSSATDLVAGDSTAQDDIVVFDTKKGTTTKASPGLAAAEGDGNCFEPVVSNNGRWVAFNSYAGNLVTGDTNGKSDAFLYDRKKGVMRRVSVPPPRGQGKDDTFFPRTSPHGQKHLLRLPAPHPAAGDNNRKTRGPFRVDLKRRATTL